MSEFYSKLAPLVEGAASAICNGYPDYIQKQDVAQAMWEWAYSNRANIEALIDASPSWNYMVMRTMRKAGNAFALQEDADTNGYDVDDIHHYSLEQVRQLLEVCFDHEDWQSFSTLQEGSDMPRAKKLVNQGGDFVAMLIDVKAAAERLPEDQYNALVWHYKYQYTYPMLGDELGISEEAAKKRVQRAVGAVRRELGQRDLQDLRRGYSARSGAAHSAEARAIVERDYEG